MTWLEYTLAALCLAGVVLVGGYALAHMDPRGRHSITSPRIRIRRRILSLIGA